MSRKRSEKFLNYNLPEIIREKLLKFDKFLFYICNCRIEYFSNFKVCRKKKQFETVIFLIMIVMEAWITQKLEIQCGAGYSYHSSAR